MDEKLDFTSISKDSQQLIDLINIIYSGAMDIDSQHWILGKIGEVKGLYSAYKIEHSAGILEIICEKLCEIILDLMHKEARSRNANLYNIKFSSKIKNICVREFYNYLNKLGKSQGTIEIYMRAFRRVVMRGNYEEHNLDLLSKRADELIETYENETPKNFTVISMLKHFRDFAEEKKFKRVDNFEYKVVVYEGEEGTPNVLWEDNCTQECAIVKFGEIVREVVKRRREENILSNWEPIRLLDKDNNIVRREG